MDVPPDVLLHELRLGERETFVRYYEAYRAPVYDFVRRLLRDADDAVAATQEVFTAEYRRILLHDDGIAVRERTYRAALDVCRRRLDEREADHGASVGHEEDGSDLGRRFAQALEMLPFSHQAALLLHDVNGLRAAEAATVFGVTEDAASALLFRAREEFRRAFEELSPDRRATTCRLAEQTAAGAVGRSLSDDDVRRLHEHAAYCRPCRRSVKAWGEGALGLALFLEDAPLPQALGTAPVFGTTIPIHGSLGAVAGAGMFAVVLARIGRSLTSRAAAYALAAACIALAVGLAMHQSPGAQTFIMVPAATPSIPRLVQPVASSVRPPSSSGHTGVTRTRPAAHPAGTTSRRSATRPVVVTSPRAATRSPAPLESYAGAVEPKVATVTDAGGSADGKHPPAGDSAVAGTEGSHVATHEGHTMTHPEATQVGHATSPAAANHDENGGERHADRHGERHAEQSVKEHAGTHDAGTHRAKTHHAHKKSKKDH